MDIIKLLLVIMLLFSTGALADDLLDNRVGDNGEEDSLKYNTFENEWGYAGEDSINISFKSLKKIYTKI